MPHHAALFAIDCAAVLVALLLAAALVRAAPRDPRNQLSATILVVSAGFVVFARTMFAGWIPEPYRFATPAGVMLVLQVAMNATPGLFMLLCFRAFQEPEARVPRALIGLFALQLLLEDALPALLGVTTHPSPVATMTDANPLLWWVFETAPASIQAMLIAAALYWTLSDWRADLVESRRRLRALLALVMGVNMVALTLLTRLLLAAGDVRTFYVHEASIAFGALLACVVLVVRARAPDARVASRATHAANAPATASANSPAAGDQASPAAVGIAEAPAFDADLAAFEAAMARHVYREHGLGITSLAKQLGIPEYRLRRLIHDRLGHRNFNQMLNAYRVADARHALADPAQRRLPILTIALSLGYQSINPFNRAFREITGATPSNYRRGALGGAALDAADDGDG